MGAYGTSTGASTGKWKFIALNSDLQKVATGPLKLVLEENRYISIPGKTTQRPLQIPIGTKNLPDDRPGGQDFS
jgi:hypothetical protein